MKRHLTLAALCAICLSITALAEVGHIEAAHGDITINRAGGNAIRAKAGVEVEQGDLLVSGANAWAVLQMVDGASLTVRPTTQLRIDEYRYADDNTPSSIALSLLKGALRSITGLIGKQNPTSYRLNTPTATIGIRGTDHETVVVDDDSTYKGAQPGTYDTVNAGETVIHGAKGDVAVQAGAVGFLHRNGTAGPALLKNRPRFFERITAFANRQGIDKVLGRLHQPLGNGAFTAHPDLKERLQQRRDARQHEKASKPEHEHEPKAEGDIKAERHARHPHRKWR